MFANPLAGRGPANDGTYRRQADKKPGMLNSKLRHGIAAASNCHGSRELDHKIRPAAVRTAPRNVVLAIPSRRCIDKYLGASPGQIAKTTRVQRAKRLLDDTKLPMIEIASRAGFRSLRRFNAVFAEVYKRPPTEIRRAQRNG